MSEEEQLGFTQPMKDFIADLCAKSDVVYQKTEDHHNLRLKICDLDLPLRIDDRQLFYIGCRLLPNIMNYLVNILPQFVYPYIVAYLQDLSSMREDPITINELFNFLTENGNIFDSADTEG